MMPRFTSRREMLKYAADGFGLLGLAGLLAGEASARPIFENKGPEIGTPLSLKPTMFPARAKRVIFLFMSGGPSHVDTFDPKPRLSTDMGKPLPFPKPQLER